MGKTSPTSHRRYRAKCRARWAGMCAGEIRQSVQDKRCPSCEQTLSPESYLINRSDMSGLYSQCRTCHTITQRRSLARKQGLPATLTWQEIGDPPDDCPCCGARMERGDRGGRTSPSLDRIIPELGYTKQNTIWICFTCNAMKQDQGPAEMYKLADWLWKQYELRGLPLPATRLKPGETGEDT